MFDSGLTEMIGARGAVRQRNGSDGRSRKELSSKMGSMLSGFREGEQNPAKAQQCCEKDNLERLRRYQTM
jgi:hypothetical protein